MPICKLRSIKDIETIKDKTKVFDRPAYFRVEFLCSNTLDCRRQRILERRLAFCLSDCGCVFGSIGIILIPSTIFFIGNFPILPFWPNSAVYIMSTLAGALFAKLFSLIITYHLAHRTIKELISSMSGAKSKACSR